MPVVRREIYIDPKKAGCAHHIRSEPFLSLPFLCPSAQRIYFCLPKHFSLLIRYIGENENSGAQRFPEKYKGAIIYEDFLERHAVLAKAHPL
jgi:hypothetical protein